MRNHAQIFSEGDYFEGTLTWGWQCFACRAEDANFGSATAAQDGCDQHLAHCDTPAADDRPAT